MLHLVLPGVRSEDKADSGWQRIIRNLDFVVLDEIHTYQGVFGSAVSLVLRRLRRVAATYDRRPTFLTASATIGNAVQHAETLTGLDGFHLVDRDGAGRARRLVLVCNPPERRADGSAVQPGDSSEDLGRIAPQTVAIEVIAEGALATESRLPVRTIGFVRSRNGVFQLAKRIQGRLTELKRPDLAHAVAPYAATFLSDDREEAEGKLRDGSTLAIISTNALELGIDIPDLSLAVLVGYPGQVSSFRQRIGRAGRLGEGLGVLIVGDDPLQQYIARDPDSLTRLLSGAPEDVIVNPFAPEISRRFGLRPAVNDLDGLAFEDAEFFGDQLVNDYLSSASGAPDRVLAGRSYWKVEDELSPALNLRSAAGNESYTVLKQDRKNFEPIGVIDSTTAPRDAFVPAVWSGPNGETYVVTGFDTRKHEIYCEPRETGFLTRGIVVDQVEIIANHQSPVPLAGCTLGYGHLQISRYVVAYRELYFSGAERNRDVEKRWPPVEFETDGLYLRVPDHEFGNHDRDETIRALQHVLLSVAPVVVASDPNDFEATSAGSTLYLYDSFGGGLRLSQPAFNRFDEVVQLAHDIVAGCSCKAGCPSCVMLGRRPEGNRDLSKAGARAVLQMLTSAAEPTFGQ
jgi:DEAD/DEAH box helicase domain-containing protein